MRYEIVVQNKTTLYYRWNIKFNLSINCKCLEINSFILILKQNLKIKEEPNPVFYFKNSFKSQNG